MGGGRHGGVGRCLAPRLFARGSCTVLVDRVLCSGERMYLRRSSTSSFTSSREIAVAHQTNADSPRIGPPWRTTTTAPAGRRTRRRSSRASTPRSICMRTMISGGCVLCYAFVDPHPCMFLRFVAPSSFSLRARPLRCALALFVSPSSSSSAHGELALTTIYFRSTTTTRCTPKSPSTVLHH